MRVVLALMLMLLPALARADDWGRYENARFGYALDVPPGCAGAGEADNGDGQVFRSADGTQLLRVYGGNILEADFEAAIAAAMGYAGDAGWSLSYQRATPTWASYSGTRNGMILYARAIVLCGGTQYASFELEYPRRDLAPMNAVVDRLVASLRAAGRGAGC
jgi:hypothetical protein